MKVIENSKFKGHLVIEKIENGVVVDKRSVDNLVTVLGKQHYANQLSLVSLQNPINYIAIGTGTGQDEDDQTLATEAARQILTNKAQGTGGNANTIIYTTTVPAGSGTGDITEAGLFNADTAGVMVCYTSFDAITKSAIAQFILTWTVTIN